MQLTDTNVHLTNCPTDLQVKSLAYTSVNLDKTWSLRRMCQPSAVNVQLLQVSTYNSQKSCNLSIMNLLLFCSCILSTNYLAGIKLFIEINIHQLGELPSPITSKLNNLESTLYLRTLIFVYL